MRVELSPPASDRKSQCLATRKAPLRKFGKAT